MDRYFAWFGLKGSLVLTVLLSAFALALAAVSSSTVRWLCFAAMLMSSIGDIFLMHFQVIERHVPNDFAAGAGCFMLAHLLYTACFGRKISAAGFGYFNGGTAAALAIAAGCLIYFLFVCGNRSQLPLALIYLAIILLNCATVFSYAWSRGIGSPLALLAAVGAVCFLASDLVIGLGVLVNEHRFDYLIWWLYPIGQILLIVGADG